MGYDMVYIVYLIVREFGHGNAGKIVEAGVEGREYERASWTRRLCQSFHEGINICEIHEGHVAQDRLELAGSDIDQLFKISGMEGNPMNRKQFLTGIGKICACSCVCALAAKLGEASAQNSTKQSPKRPRNDERMEFAEKWAVRFFAVLDTNLDAATRKQIMMANGKACLLSWQKETNQKPRVQPVSLESFAKQVKEKGLKDYQIEGNVIYFQFNAAAETGSPSPENHCLCPMVETKPAGLSPTYCLCSLGYVKEMHEQIFQKPVEADLLSSVLRGHPRCKFKITVSS
jgi:hypothetical protein